MKKLINLLMLLIIAYLCFGGLLYLKQRSFIYFPTEGTKHPYAEITFSHKDVEVKTTVLNKGNKNAIIYFGGNAEDVDNNASTFQSLFPDQTIYLVKYRGYGGSSGTPNEQGIYSDVLYIFDQLRPQHTDLAVVGRSLGSGVATYLAAERTISKLALITPFDSIQHIAQEQFPIYPMTLMLKDKYDSFSRVKSIKAKALIIYAENDKIIPKKHTERLINEFPDSQITVEMLNNSDHNNLSNNEKYYHLLSFFLNDSRQ